VTVLDPRQLWLLRINAFVLAAILVAAVLVLDATLLRRTLLPFGWASIAAAILGLAIVLLLPRRRYRAWGYAMHDDELHIGYGAVTRVRTAVPFGRVQHIDLAQGPLQRAFGLGTIILHTAGTRNAAVALPGLAYGEAERMRDHIRSKIREDLM
jgi:membrane protein YdbS with pleckstrin-like domain